MVNHISQIIDAILDLHGHVEVVLKQIFRYFFGIVPKHLTIQWLSNRLEMAWYCSQVLLSFIELFVDVEVWLLDQLDQLFICETRCFSSFLMDQVASFLRQSVGEVLIHCLLYMRVLESAVEHLPLSVPSLEWSYVVVVRVFKATGCGHHEDSFVFEVDWHGETSLELTSLEGVVADV